MSKYIIEIPDNMRRICIDAFGDGYGYTQAKNVDDLEELNSDYINEHFGSLQDEAYQAGLKDGYGTAKSLVWETSANEYTSLGINIYDWGEDESEVLRHYSAQEAVDLLHKIREHKDSDRIEVGDIVDVYGSIGVVTYTYENTFNVMMCDGSTGDWRREDLKKTGKHYDIQSILEAMRK